MSQIIIEHKIAQEKKIDENVFNNKNDKDDKDLYKEELYFSRKNPFSFLVDVHHNGTRLSLRD
ncbi:hypothetical protein PFDG_05078 [Plasmodium falciparum Dd2]|uniref:Uncharacterized protein n=1 Tax=Plasmodium falciparum (isolate Dd2) TaxID=57267 RepID=A0A0L7M9I6_PLAF4|nr:hypothetical protein PFDG_05078 [Plasmodium falciparum Dd2]